MIRIEFDPGELSGEEADWWRKWEAKAETAKSALEELVEAEEPLDFKEEVWRELKQWLFDNVFFKKCAYCEGKVTPQGFGDAEHWRPKAAVKQRRNGSLKAVEVAGKPHPGYWWLAYEWANLLPACEKCNSGKGKGAQFPIAGEYACEPCHGPTVDELDAREQPLLLHPFRGPDPADHVGFNEFGQVYAIKESPHGDTSIKVFDLDRSDLEEDRYSHIRRAEDTFLRAANDVAREGCGFSEALDGLSCQSTPYSAALRSHQERWLENFLEKLHQ